MAMQEITLGADTEGISFDGPAEMRVCDRIYRPEDVATEVEVDNAPSGSTEAVYGSERIPARQ